MCWRKTIAALLLTALSMPAAAQGMDDTHLPTAAARYSGDIHYFTAGQDKLAYRSWGKGPVTIILPGGPGIDAAYMLDVAQDIAAASRRAILLEQRGTGASRAALGDGSRLTVAGSIADVEALRRSLGADRITLIGHSFGGGIAQAYAAAFPGHVARLILMNSVGPDMRPTAAPLDSWRTRLSPDELAAFDAARARGDRLAAMKVKFLGSFYHRERGVAFLEALPDSAIHQDVAKLSDDYARHYDIRATGRSSTFPVIILAGEVDWIRGYEAGLREAWPRATTIVIPQAGHFPWADAPAATRSALRTALTADPS